MEKIYQGLFSQKRGARLFFRVNKGFYAYGACSPLFCRQKNATKNGAKGERTMWQRFKNLIKKKKGYTFMVVPNNTGTTRSLNIPFLVVLIFFCLLGANLYFLVRYPTRIHKIVGLQRQIDQLSDIINRQDRDLRQIDPSLKKTQEIEEQINNNNKLAAEIQELYAEILRKTKGRKTVSRGLVYRPIQLPQYKLSSADNDLTKLQILNENLDFLDKEIKKSDEVLKSLIVDLQSYDRELDHTPTIWPVYGRITSGFGGRIHPITRKWTTHTGVDLSAGNGTRVRAAADGVVEYAGYNGGYGWCVIINHGYGYKTLYAHNSKLLVKRGQRVNKGKIISYSGSSGRSTGPHLHYEVWRNGTRVNPVNYLWQ